MADFNGVQYPTPTVVYVENDSQAANTGGAGATNVVVMADALGGTPATNPLRPDGSTIPVDVFSDAGTALNILRGGLGCYLVQNVFANGGRTVYFIRTNPATASTVTLLDTNSVSSMTVQSKGFGLWTALTSLAISAGTNQTAYPGGVKIIVTDTSKTPNIVISQDNIWKNYFQLQYVGTGSACTATINGTSLTTTVTGYQALNIHYVGTSSPASVTVAATTGGGGNITLTSATGPETQVFSFATYPTMGALIAAINAFQVTGVKIYNATSLYTGIGGINASSTLATLSATDCKTATPVLTATGTDLNLAFSSYSTLDKLTGAILSSGPAVAYSIPTALIDSSLFSANLDYKTAADIKTAVVNLTAIQQAVLDFLNGYAGDYTVATRTGGLPPANIATTYLAGGVEGSTATGDWNNGLTRAQALDTPIMVIGATDSTTQALVNTHVNMMCDGGPGHRPRRAYMGGPGAQTRDQAAAQAQLLNNKRCVFFWPGLRNADPSGTQKSPFGVPLVINQDANYLAAMAAGIKASGTPQTPLTRAYIPTVGLQYEPTPDDLNTVTRYGVAPVLKDQATGLFYIAWAKTTYNGAPNFVKNEESVVAAQQYVQTSIIDAVNNWLSTRPVNSPTSAAELKGVVTGILFKMQTQGVIIAFDPKSVTVTAQGDQITLTFCDTPAEPVNFVFINSCYVPVIFTV